MRSKNDFARNGQSLPCVKGGVSEADGGIVGRAVPAPTSFYRTPILNVGATNGRPPLCAPILFFLFLRKKRTAAASEKTRCIPFPAKAENFIFAPFLFLPESRPLSLRRLSVDIRKRTSKTGSALVSPNCDPAKRSQFGKEEGASEYGAFAAPAEVECSWLLLTPRRTLS